MPRLEYDKLSKRRLGACFEAIQKRVETARQRQRGRFSKGRGGSQTRPDARLSAGPSPVLCNADMLAEQAQPADVRKHCDLDDTCRALMKTAMSVRSKLRHAALGAPVNAFSSWRAPSPLWQAQGALARRTWRRQCSTARGV